MFREVFLPSRLIRANVISTGHHHMPGNSAFDGLTVPDYRLELTLSQDGLAHIKEGFGINIALAGLAVDRMPFLVQCDAQVRPFITRHQFFGLPGIRRARHKMRAISQCRLCWKNEHERRQIQRCSNVTIHLRSPLRNRRTITYFPELANARRQDAGAAGISPYSGAMPRAIRSAAAAAIRAGSSPSLQTAKRSPRNTFMPITAQARTSLSPGRSSPRATAASKLAR